METNDDQTKIFDLFKLLSFLAAFLALIGFTIFIKFLITKVGTPDAEWIRLMYLFGSVEAIVFAAAGFLFGREVNRQRANSAENDAAKKEKEAELAKQKEEEAKKKAEQTKQEMVSFMHTADAEYKKAQLFASSIMTASENDDDCCEKILNLIRKDSSRISSVSNVQEEKAPTSREPKKSNTIKSIIGNFYPELLEDDPISLMNGAVNFDYSFTGSGFQAISFNGISGSGESGSMEAVPLNYDGKVTVSVIAENHTSWQVKFSLQEKTSGGKMKTIQNPTTGTGTSSKTVYFRNR